MPLCELCQATAHRKVRVMADLGYIVTWEGSPLHEERRKAFPEACGVLYCGATATVYPTRRAAWRAVKRTRNYAATYMMPWSDLYNVIRLEATRVR
jgi:hypothetical protein